MITNSKKPILATLLALLVLIPSLFCFPKKASSAPFVQDFKVLNLSGKSIVNIYSKPTGSQCWSQDILAYPPVLRFGEVTEFSVPGVYDYTRYWDLKFRFSDGDVWTFLANDLFRVSTIAVMADQSIIWE